MPGRTGRDVTGRVMEVTEVTICSHIPPRRRYHVVSPYAAAVVMVVMLSPGWLFPENAPVTVVVVVAQTLRLCPLNFPPK